MAVSRQGLNRALLSSSCPAWKRTQSGTRGRLKPDYDAVVIGAGKVKEGRARAQGGKAAPYPQAFGGASREPPAVPSSGRTT